MESKIMQVFYDTDCLPYKDSDRTVHYPIVGSAFNGANNTTQIRFFVDRIGGTESVSWVVVAKLPNGKIIYQVLNGSYADSELGENYVQLDLSSYYTSLKGDVYISLSGYQGGVQVEEDANGIYTISGTPTIQTTGAIKLAINYAPQFPLGAEIGISDLQQVLGALAGKSNIEDAIIVLNNISTADLSSYETDQIFYDKNTNTYYTKSSALPYYQRANSNGILAKKHTICRDSEGLQYDIEKRFSSVKSRQGSRLFVYEYNNKDYLCCIDSNNYAYGYDIITKTYYVKQFTDTTEKFDFLFYSGITSKYILESSQPYSVYTTPNLTGGVQMRKIGNDYQNIPIRATNGHLWVPLEPSANNHAASKYYVDSQVAEFKENEITVVDTIEYATLDSFLASPGTEGYIYLYPVDTSDLTKGYYRYVWENNAWLSLGTTEIDLSDYYTKTETDNKYVAKTSDGEKVYGTDEQGNQITYSVDSDLVGDGEIVRRESGTGTVVVGTPTSNTHATTKSYVDTGLSSKVDLTSTQTISGAKTFSNGIATDSFKRTNDNETYIERSGYSTIFYGNVIPKYNNSADLGTDTLKWKDLYLTGNLSDGSNSLGMTDLINKVAEFDKVMSMYYETTVDIKNYEFDYITLSAIPLSISSQATIFSAGTDLVNVKGNSFVVNQLVQNGNFADSSNWTNYSNTRTSLSVSSNKATLTILTTDGSKYEYGLQQTLSNDLQQHKYLATCYITSSFSSKYKIELASGYSDYTLNSITSKTFVGMIINVNGTIYNNAFLINPLDNFELNDTYSVEKAQLIDLTLCGLDSVSTTDQAISELAKRGIDVYTYNSYNTGTIVDSKPNKLSTIGANLFNVANVLNKDGDVIHKVENGYNYDIYTGTVGYDSPIPSNFDLTKLIYLNAGTYIATATLPAGKDAYIMTVNDDRSVDFLSYINGSSFTLTTNSYITIRMSTDGLWDMSKVMINRGSTAMSYLPYQINDYNLSLPTLRSAGSVQDDVSKVRVGTVDLGSLEWTKLADGVYYSNSLNGVAKSQTDAPLICSKYATEPLSQYVDNSIAFGYSFASVGILSLVIQDATHTEDAATFKTNVNGMVINYELATPTDQVATNLPENVNIQKGGTIQVEYASGYETPSDFTFEFATSKIGE